jgi:hypothetical protein
MTVEVRVRNGLQDSINRVESYKCREEREMLDGDVEVVGKKERSRVRLRITSRLSTYQEGSRDDWTSCKN